VTQPLRNSLFTTAEAAFLTRLPLWKVQRAIDNRLFEAVFKPRTKRVSRLLDRHALLCLAVERRLGERCVPRFRRAVYETLATAPRGRLSLDGGFLTIDLAEPRHELATGLRTLRRARAAFTRGPGIMRGVPVFRGTRIPVRLIASLRALGVGEAELLTFYPNLTADDLRLAEIYLAANPARGRRCRRPWHAHAPLPARLRELAQLKAERGAASVSG